MDETNRDRTASPEDERYKAAKKRVEDVKGFWVHLLVYLCVNAGLFLINLVSSPGTWWVQWVLLGWGIGLAIHALSVFVFEGRIFGPAWEQRQIDRIMQRDGGERPGEANPPSGKEVQA